MKRFFAILLALTLLLSALPIAAEEGAYDPTDSYVLNYYTDETGTVSNNNAWYYFSVYMPSYIYEGNSSTTSYIAFSLREDGTGDSSLFPVYCTDLGIGLETGASYRRLNLEDSTYAGNAAEMLRSIYLHGFPGTTPEAISIASGVKNVTIGEAIAATQAAIWKAAHGEIADFTDLCYAIDGVWTETMTVKYTESIAEYTNSYATAENLDSIRERINTVYNYLLALDPTPARDVVVSEAAFGDRKITSVAYNTDGTCNITVTATVSAVIDDADDKLTLTAYLADGEYYASTEMKNGEQTYTLTIRNAPAACANATVTLAVDGTQRASDVFLFDAEGYRGASQSLIGELEKTLPVHAEVKVEPDRVLEINHKKDTATNAALSNISFNVYYVGSVEDYRNGKLNIGASPTDADITKYAKSTKLVGTLTTDETGCASLNFGTEDGVYLVKELPNAAVEGSVAFFVSLPDWSRLDENGNPAYTITASPKNTTVSEEVDIKKDVTEIDKDSDTFAVGEKHTWIIRTFIPKNIGSGKSYVITDTLDRRLNYDAFDRVELIDTTDEAAKPTVLDQGTHYTVDTRKVTSEDHEADFFTVSLTAAGMKKIAALVGSDYANYELRTYFTAVINQNAKMGENIPNQAHVKYTNQVGKIFEKDSDQPEVHTGGAQLKKVDAADKSKALSGATFAVYRIATQGEAAADTEDEFPTYTVENAEGATVTTKLVPVEFYDNATLTGEKVKFFTTGENGLGYIYGLAYGDYYLVETKAPDGYNLLAGPVKFTVDAESHTESRIVTVENTTGAVLPSTGGPGTAAFTVGGTALMAAAVLLLRRRKTA